MKSISVVVPLYNEEEVFEELLRRLTESLKQFSYELVFVDDGSTDRTRELLRHASQKDGHVVAVLFSRNFGHQAAVRAGLIESKNEYVIVMDGDLQDPPEVLPKFLEELERGTDVAYAIRKKRKESILKRAAYSSFYKILHKISGEVSMPKDSGDFCAMSRRAVDALKSLEERNQYVRGIRSWVGFVQKGVEYERDRRFAGETKYSLKKLFKLAYDGIFSFSYFPLVLISALGALSALGAFAGIIVVLYFRLFTEAVIPGFASTAIFVLFLGGVQLASIGVIGEYIKRIYDEVKKRPHYIISEVLKKAND